MDWDFLTLIKGLQIIYPRNLYIYIYIIENEKAVIWNIREYMQLLDFIIYKRAIFNNLNRRHKKAIAKRFRNTKMKIYVSIMLRS